MKATVLVTGAAGFVGFHVAQRLLQSGVRVVGIDNLNTYYAVALKQARLGVLQRHAGFCFHEIDIVDESALDRVFASNEIRHVVHLAAQAGVRHSIDHPDVYVKSNLLGFCNVIEACRRHVVEHLIYASSSSVYGSNTKLPFSVDDSTDRPISLYAATKKSNELIAHAYAHSLGVPSTGLRFFSVYGPWGRPDMAYYTFTKAILEGREINLYHEGRHKRDFTYIDDVVTAVVKLLDLPFEHVRHGHAGAPYRLYNVGNRQPVEMRYFLSLLERELGRAARVNLLPLQVGDMVETYADVDDLVNDTGFHPHTTIEEGLHKFVAWYRSYHGVPAPAASKTHFISHLVGAWI